MGGIRRFTISALMDPTGSVDGLVVATPERVTFHYQVAGLGSRFIAQLIDVAIILVLLIILTLAAFGIASATGDGNGAALVWVLATFVLFFGYYPLFEGIWSGQTPGKRLLRLRVIGDRGEPVTIAQVGIRNLVRIVDFMPVFYGVGVVCVFIQGGKRLGDFAAGTVVARERERVKLSDLVSSACASAPAAAAPEARKSIWAADNVAPAEAAAAPAAMAGTPAAPVAPGAVPAPAAPAPAPRPATRLDPYQEALRRVDPAMRRFIVAYAQRRNQLPIYRREALAAQVAGGLHALLPSEVAAFGPVAVLDGLAALVYAEAMAH
ncbi:MAG: hypothetical protein QOE92_159 [Chloroflexota bacterium]|nr:hypothetical protein [Chloroflexota bacterium]